MISILEPQKTVGYYEVVKNTRFYTTSRPNWWFRLWTRLLLGWVWRDDPL